MCNTPPGNLNGPMLSTCANNSHIVYVDGKQVNSNPQENEYNQTILTPIPNKTKVIAVSITNYGGEPGFKAALSNTSVVSDDSWKCSSTFTDGWQKIGFDDSSWLPAVTTGSILACAGFPSSAKFLRIDESYDAPIMIYCRKTVSLLRDTR